MHRSSWTGPGPIARPVVAWTIQLPGPIVHRLSADDQAIYAVAGGSVHRVSREGVVQWATAVNAASPVARTERGLAVACRDGGIVLLNPETGVEAERIALESRVRGTPLPVGSGLAWVEAPGHVVGEAGWRVDLGAEPAGGPASDDTAIYTSTIDGRLVAVTSEGVRWRVGIPGPGLGHPVVGETHVFAAFGAHDDQPGGIAAVKRTDGSSAWWYDSAFEPGAPPALGSALIVAGKEGGLVALSPETGAELWTLAGMGELTATPALAAGRAFAGSADSLVRQIDLADGGETWAVKLDAPVSGDPVVVGPLLVVGLTNGDLVALRSP